MRELDLNKRLVTRGGDKAIFFGRRKHSSHPLVFLIYFNGEEEIIITTEEGYQFDSNEYSENDIFNEKQKREGWVNIYSKSNPVGIKHRDVGFMFNTKEEAIQNSSSYYDLIETVKVEWEE